MHKEKQGGHQGNSFKCLGTGNFFHQGVIIWSNVRDLWSFLVAYTRLNVTMSVGLSHIVSNKHPKEPIFFCPEDGWY